MEFSETPKPARETDPIMPEKKEYDFQSNEEHFDLQSETEKREKLNSDREKQAYMDNEKISQIKSLLGLEQVDEDSVQIFKSEESVMDFDTALGEIVLEDHPNKIVDNVLRQIPNGFSIEDNNLGEIKKSIRIWITESAGNSARHINYRQKEDANIQYKIGIFCRNLIKDKRRYLQISFQLKPRKFN